MKIHSNSFAHGKPIPEEFAFGRRGPGGQPIALSENRNPHLVWDEVPEGAQSFALICVDPDVPTVPGLANRTDVTIPERQPRTDFIHWVMIDIPPECRSIAAGACSNGITPRGKQAPPGPAGARQGCNDYTAWFADDPEMKGNYLGYDGPCPPFNDERVHRYFFRLFALATARLPVPPAFTVADVYRAMQKQILAETAIYGTYTLRR